MMKLIFKSTLMFLIICCPIGCTKPSQKDVAGQYFLKESFYFYSAAPDAYVPAYARNPDQIIHITPSDKNKNEIVFFTDTYGEPVYGRILDDHVIAVDAFDERLYVPEINGLLTYKDSIVILRCEESEAYFQSDGYLMYTTSFSYTVNSIKVYSGMLSRKLYKEYDY